MTTVMRQRDKGTALVAAMIAVFVISGLVTGLYTVVMSASYETATQTEYAVSLEMAESGIERYLAELNRAKILYTSEGTVDGLEGLAADPTLPYYGVTLYEGQPQERLGGYRVYVESLGTGGVAGVFDRRRITSISLPSRGRDPGNWFYRGVRAVVSLPYPEDEENELKAIPAGLVSLGHGKLEANSLSDCQDHPPGDAPPPDGVPVPVDSKLDMTYGASHAGYISEFWVQYGDQQFKIFDDSDAGGAIDETSTQTFPAGEDINFFIKTFAPDETYNHYAFGDSPSAVYYPPGNQDPQRYCRVEQLNDTTYRLFFEDLEGSKADWDYGAPGDLTVEECIASTGHDGPDQVIDVVFTPSDEEPLPPPPESADPGAGIPALATPYTYDDLGLPDDSGHLLTQDEEGDYLTGKDAYDEIPENFPVMDYMEGILGDTTAGNGAIDDYDNTLVDNYHTLTNLNRSDLGSDDDYQVTYANPSSGRVLISGKTEGNGILVVNGNLKVTGQLHWDGLVLVNGNVTMTGSHQSDRILGALMATGNIEMRGNAKLLYSSKAVLDALAARGWDLSDLEKLLPEPPPPKNLGTPTVIGWRDLDDPGVVAFGRTLPGNENEDIPAAEIRRFLSTPAESQ